jgi:hypothetical protein
MTFSKAHGQTNYNAKMAVSAETELINVIGDLSGAMPVIYKHRAGAQH